MVIFGDWYPLKVPFWGLQNGLKMPFFVIFLTSDADFEGFRVRNDPDTVGPCKASLGGPPAQTVSSYLY